MPFFAFDPETEKGAVLRNGLNHLRSARYELDWVVGMLNQMTNQQIADEFGFADTTVAGNAKAELQSGIGKLLSKGEGDDAGLLASQIPGGHSDAQPVWVGHGHEHDHLDSH